MNQYHRDLEAFVERAAQFGSREARELIARRPVAGEVSGERWYVLPGAVYRFTDGRGVFWTSMLDIHDVHAVDSGTDVETSIPDRYKTTRSAAVAQIDAWGWPVPEEIK